MTTIGVPTEVKADERRVGLTPGSVREVVGRGNEVFVQSGAGDGAGFGDSEYESAGALVVDGVEEVFASADLIVKVKEPQANERGLLTERHTLFAYLHLAPDPVLTDDLVSSGATCIAYETVTDRAGRLPLLTPMSQVAGRMSIQAAAYGLEAIRGGRGLLLGGVPGVAPAKVTVIGGGVVGSNAVQMAVGVGAEVVVLDRDLAALEELSHRFGSAMRGIYSTEASLEDEVLDADVVIGAVLVPGAAAPKLVTESMVQRMRPGSVLVDVAIDQGGCFATSRPTTHSAPIYVLHEVVHYCVANIPGAVPRTSTLALNNATLPFVVALADEGPITALRNDSHLREGLNVHRGLVTERPVSEALGLEYFDASDALTR